MQEQDKTLEQLNFEFFSLYQLAQPSALDSQTEEDLKQRQINWNIFTHPSTSLEEKKRLLEIYRLGSPIAFPKFEIVSFPYLPSKVDKKRLKANGKLLGEQTIKLVQNTKFINPAELLLVEKKLFDGYEVIFLNGSHYAIYPDLIAEGSFGRIYLMQNLASGEWDILKQSKQMPDDNVVTKTVENEYSILSHLKMARGKGATSQESQNAPVSYVFGIERIPGIPLSELALENFNELQLLELMIGTLEAEEEMRNKKILHRDIKHSNLLYIPPGKVRFVDMGAAVLTESGQHTDSEFVGTDKFSAPELRKRQSSYVYSEKTEAFSVGEVLEWICSKNNKIKSKVSGQIAQMKKTSPAKRPSLQSSIDFFKKTKDNYLTLMGDFKNVGIIDIDELISHEADINIEFIKALRLMDAVWIVGKKSSIESKHLGKIMENLANKGIMLAGTVVGEGLVDGLTDFIEKNSEVINRYFYVSKNPKAKEMPENHKCGLLQVKNNADYKTIIKNHDVYLSTRQFDMVMGSLYKELNRLKERKASKFSIGSAILDARVKAVKKAQQELGLSYKENKLTYNSLKIKIEQLQKEMDHTNPIKRILSYFFKTKGHEMLSQIPTEIHRQGVRAR